MADGSLRLRPLLLSRVADQGSLALASFAMALVLDPDGYARVAVVLVFASFSVQLSDLGVGFAMMSRGGDRLRASTARRLRRGNILLAGGAVVLAVIMVALGASVAGAGFIAYGGIVWAATGEAFVRRSAALTEDLVPRVARAEAGAAAVLVVGVGVAVALASAEALAIALVLRHLTEALLLPGWEASVAEDGRPLGAPLEWIGQAVTFVAANADYLVVAWYFGGSALAVYTLSFRTASGAFALLANPLTQRALVDLGEVGPAQPDELRRRYDVVLSRQVLAGAVAAGAAVVAAPIVSWALDASWEQTLALTIVLAAALPARLLVGPTVALGLALQRRGFVVAVECGRGALLLGAGLTVAALGGTLLQATFAMVIATIIGALAASALVSRGLGAVPFAHLARTAGIGALVAGGGWLVISP